METQKAYVLAAGKGERLDHIHSPKPLASVGSDPMIVRVILQLIEAGITDISVVVGHRGNEIKSELLSNPKIKTPVSFIEQTTNDTTAGLLNSFLIASNSAEGPVIITMADLVFLENPFTKILETVGTSNKVSLIVSQQLEDRENIGAQSMVTEQNGVISDIGRSVQGNALEVGIYYVPAKGLVIESDTISDIESLFRELARADKLEAVSIDLGQWFDVNTPAVHTRANMMVREQEQAPKVQVQESIKRSLEPHSFFYRHKTLHSDIFVQRGLIKDIAAYDIIPSQSRSSAHFIITDDRVDGFYGDRVLTSLLADGLNVKKIVVPEGEATKNISVFSDVADEIFSYGLDKHSIIFSLGGGVINNLAGVLASTLYRGIGLMHIPTSSMSQVDAALDFKQAINSSLGKNLIGSYYPASKILIDPEALLTLDDRHLNNGIAESIKHALTQSVEFAEVLRRYAPSIHDVTVLQDIVSRTIKLKVPLLCGDVADDVNEMLPQYGHSVAHAVEHLSAYQLLHGEAVTIGICVSAEISKILGFCDDETVDAHYELSRLYSLPTSVPDTISADEICDKIRYDKHYVKGCPHMALPVAVGEMWNADGVYSVPVEYETLKRAIEINKLKS